MGLIEMKAVVLLNSVDKVREFVKITQEVSYDVDLRSNRGTYLDGKSILGIMSCDIRKPLQVDIHAEIGECREYLDDIDRFIVQIAV